MLCAWPTGLSQVRKDSLIFTRESPSATLGIWSKIVHWCPYVHRLELQKILNFCAVHSPVRLDRPIETKFLISNYWQPWQNGNFVPLVNAQHNNQKTFCSSSLWKCLDSITLWSYKEAKINHRFFDDFIPGHVPLISAHHLRRWPSIKWTFCIKYTKPRFYASKSACACASASSTQSRGETIIMAWEFLKICNYRSLSTLKWKKCS